MNFFHRKAKLSESAALSTEQASPEGELREFVYLDEVSVRSLRASRVGALPSELRDMRSAVLAAEMSGTVTATVPAVVKASIQSTLTSTRSGGAEILRKTIVQSDFKDLRDGELHRLLVGPARQAAPAFEEHLLETHNQWIMRAKDVARSGLVEMTVRLGAAGIFKVGAVFESLTTLFSQSRLDPATARTLQDMGPMNEMVQELLAGLVPIECIAVDYQVGEIDGEDWLVHNSMISHLPSLVNIRPLVLVATTTSSLYWQDLRQILFSDLEFDVLARVTRSGVANAWSPVKLADVFRTFSPATADAVDNLDSLARQLMAEHASKESLAPTPIALAPMTERKLLAFAIAATGGSEAEIPEDVIEGIRAIAVRYPNVANVSEMHSAYDEVCDLLFETVQLEVPLIDRARLRAGANAIASDSPAAATATNAAPDVARATIEAEVVAIYW